MKITKITHANIDNFTDLELGNVKNNVMVKRGYKLVNDYRPGKFPHVWASSVLGWRICPGMGFDSISFDDPKQIRECLRVLLKKHKELYVCYTGYIYWGIVYLGVYIKN